MHHLGTFAILAILAFLPWQVVVYKGVINHYTSVDPAICRIRLETHQTEFGNYKYTNYILEVQKYATVFCTDQNDRNLCGGYYDDHYVDCYLVESEDFTYAYLNPLAAKCAKSGLCDSIYGWFVAGSITALFCTVVTLIYALIGLSAGRGSRVQN